MPLITHERAVVVSVESDGISNRRRNLRRKGDAEPTIRKRASMSLMAMDVSRRTPSTMSYIEHGSGTAQIQTTRAGLACQVVSSDRLLAPCAARTRKCLHA